MVSILFKKKKNVHMITIFLFIFFISIRGGLVQASKRYAKANNMMTPGYDDTKEKSWIIYQDCKSFFFQLFFNFFQLNR